MKYDHIVECLGIEWHDRQSGNTYVSGGVYWDDSLIAIIGAQIGGEGYFVQQCWDHVRAKIGTPYALEKNGFTGSYVMHQFQVRDRYKIKEFIKVVPAPKKSVFSATDTHRIDVSPDPSISEAQYG